MKVTELIKQQKKAFFSLEITPPLKTKNIRQIFSTLKRLMPYNPAFINITYHQETTSIEEIDGVPTQIVYQKHASTVGVCSAIKYNFDIEVVPHFICGGFNKLETENALFDLMFLGIENILALRGDPKKNQEHFTPQPYGHAHASDLVEQIRKMNQSHYLHTNHPKDSFDFCIGVAGYPEKHYEAKSLDNDILMLKKKVDAGADFVITQMFFDYDLFCRWEETCRKNGINIPIIPGLKPITQKKQVRRLAENFNIQMPSDLISNMDKTETADGAYEIGITYMSKLCEKLIAHGVPGIHFFTMGNGQDVADVMKHLHGEINET